MSQLRLSPQVFLILSRAIEEHSGIHYELVDADLLAVKVSPRAIEAGFDSLLDYYYFLRYDPRGAREMELLVEHLVVNETYFCRELEPLVVLIERFLRPRIEKGRHTRVWSAACATGEEPLTLAVLLARRGLLHGVDIVGSDLSARALQRAREGCFAGRSLRALPHPEMGDLVSADGRVDPSLVSAIEWRRINLLDTLAIASLESFDAVLLRNVLIYFSDATAQQVVRNTLSTLRPDGLLVVGVSESLLRMDALVHCEEHAGVFFYRRGQA